ncbi:hypothetical protein Ddye_031729 [Dipteronia dyeriana]|uniref:Uncharacterized protein n=1 Tax=Dipteronia dyeriana TaxID=168575 RepID=A0AAD9TIY5_9ROSI|nr:hypothetical protein Ddye_031729 [Dipteronia dyeriana]
MSEVNTFDSSFRESFSYGCIMSEKLEHMISSPEVSDFFRRLKLNQKWLNGFKSNLQRLGWILGDAESKAYVNKEVKVWLDKLNEVSYDLEDLLDEIVTQKLSHQDKPRNIKIQIRGIFSAKLSSLEKVIKQRLEEITVEIENLQRQSDTLGLQKASRIRRELVGRYCIEDESQAIGRAEDKEALLKLLLSDGVSADHDHHTMVGERGVGKTTLAQLVYNDERVKKQFEFKGWIHVSEDFDDLLLSKAIFLAFTDRPSYIEDLDILQTSLKKHLYGKKFLLVLDNLTTHFDLTNLQKVLTSGANGSRIIVTTCHPELQETIGTLPAFTVKSLTYQESWMLFAQHVFPDKSSSLLPKLEDIGKEIVEKCRGVPLAAKILASVLHFKPVEEWQALLNNNSILKWDNEDPITSFLEMSYNDLPIHLKRCVAYCSIFPTHHEHEEEKLILLWMAEGFLQQKEGTRMQEVGREYFRNLTYRSFFQPSGANKSCFIMHDLLKDLALVESGFICSRMGSNQNSEVSKVSSKTRHVLISGGRYIAERCKAISACKYLRTLILYRSSWDTESCQLSIELLTELFDALQCLRVLSLSRSDITILTDSIGKLKYLRFLDLSYTEITGLPDSVSSLYNLQTLLLSHCSRLTRLPDSVPKISSLQFLDHSYTAITWLPDSVSSFHNLQTWLLSHCSVTNLPDNMRELNNLRHVDIRGTNLNQMPADMGYLTRLQHLSDFFVGKVSGSQIEQLGHLSNLQGTLHISELQHLESAGVASEARLEKKAYLQGLELEWNKATVDFHTERPVLDKLKPHKNLEMLSIISYDGTRFPDWLGDSSFTKMVFLRLSNCKRCSHLPPLGQLLSLKELEIEGMNGIIMVGPEFYGKNPSSDKLFPSHPSLDEPFPSHPSSDKPFPSLEILVFREMMEWEEWISPEVEGENFPRLKWICISGCPKLAICSPLHLPPSAEVEILGCPLLGVPVTDGNKMQFRSDDELARRPLTPPVWTKFQLPERYRVQLKNDDEITSQYLEHRTNNILSPSHSSPPVSPMLLAELEFPKVPVIVQKQLHESHSRKEKLLDIPSTSTPQKIEELQLRDNNAVHSTDDSIKSNRPPPESYKHLTEDSSAKHEVALDTSSAAAEISSDPGTDDPINDRGDKTQFRRNEKLLDRTSTSRLQGIEELQLLSQENMFEAQKNMSEIKTFESSVRESFSSVFLKPLGHMISSPEVSDFFRRLKLNEKWLNNLLSLDKLLGDAESKAYVNKEVKVWLDDLNEVSYDLEDLLEEIVMEELSHQDKPRHIKIRIQGIFSAKLSSLEKVIKQRLEEITVKIENLQRHSEILGLQEASWIKREPCQQSHVIGREKDEEAIIKLLLSDGVSTDQTRVITMVGEHGVGKTTLAQLVYDNEKVKKQFDSKVWIQVWEDLDDLLLTNTIFLAFTSLPSDIEDLDSLQTSLKECLCKKKFLLVLDNLTMRSDWRNLQKVLTAGEKGSRIIVTTCHPELQETMGTLPAFTVRSLTDQESWMVFAKHAFPDKNSCLHPELEDIGKEILDKCRGLPLAAKILGSVLSFKPVEEWRALLENNKLKWGEDPITFFSELSYNDLPIHLKRCAAYCSIFSPYHNYEEEKLILLWMAEGFLQQKEGTRMEEVGREYFRNLTYRSFFQPSGAYKSCFISNDLLKDLAPSESGFICDIMGNDEYFKVSRNTRHLLISGDKNLAEKCKAIGTAKFLRTLILYKPYWENESCQLSVELLNDLFEALQRLRVLSLPFYDITILPHSIGKLKYLRFLDLSYTAITELPHSVSSLYNLQTLLLSHCFVAELPENMRNLINLRYLDIRGTLVQEMPADMGCLTNLQYLSDFFVGNDSGSKIKELGPLSNLQGILHISQLQNVVSDGDASEASLKNKTYLQGLELEWSNAAVDSQNETGVLEQLEPHRNLKNLSIISYGGTRFPNWLGDSSFFKMVFLHLSNCNSCPHLPPLGQLPSLQELEIEGMNGVKMVGPEFYGMNSSLAKPFPSLEILVFRVMLKWEEWISPEVEGEVFPSLKQICILGCPKLAKCSPLYLPPSAEIELSGCSLLRVPVTDGNKIKFVSENKPARPPLPPIWLKLQLPDSYGVQLKNKGETAFQDVWSTSLSSPPESSILSNELALPEPPVTAEKQLRESNSRKEKLLGRPSTLRLPEVEELQLPEINVAHSTDVSITSSRPPPESPMPLTEDSSAKHGGALDTSSSGATEISSDSDTDINDPINDEGKEAQFRGNEKLLDRPSTSRFQEIEELVSNVVRRTDVSAISNSPPPESSKRLTEDTSSKHIGASDNSSYATEISSDTNTDDPINVWYDEESLEDISSPEQESLNVSEISQLKRLPPKLYSLKIESCKALKFLIEELMHSNLRHLYIIDCPFLKSIQVSHLPIALKTLYIRKCKKLEFLSAEETMGRHTSIEHLCIESSCDSLKSFPLALFPKLKNLSIWDCANFNSISITEDHKTLNSLEIRDCTNLESLWKSGLGTPKLTSILISNCKNLKQLPGQLHELTSLQSLIINECPELDSIPEGGLPSSLNLLRISSCHKLTPCLEWGLHKLNNFSRIEIEGGCRDLESFPEQNLLPRNLSSLQIGRFPNLKILNYKGLQHLKSLETLKINSCDKLQSLPEEGLPSSLSYLYVSDCLLLKSKLQNRRGKEWYKIAHIHHIQFDGKVIS